MTTFPFWFCRWTFEQWVQWNWNYYSFANWPIKHSPLIDNNKVAWRARQISIKLKSAYSDSFTFLIYERDFRVILAWCVCDTASSDNTALTTATSSWSSSTFFSHFQPIDFRTHNSGGLAKCINLKRKWRFRWQQSGISFGFLTAINNTDYAILQLSSPRYLMCLFRVFFFQLQLQPCTFYCSFQLHTRST